MRQVPLNTQAEFHAPLRDPTIPDCHIVSGRYSLFSMEIEHFLLGLWVRNFVGTQFLSHPSVYPQCTAWCLGDSPHWVNTYWVTKCVRSPGGLPLALRQPVGQGKELSGDCGSPPWEILPQQGPGNHGCLLTWIAQVLTGSPGPLLWTQMEKASAPAGFSAEAHLVESLDKLVEYRSDHAHNASGSFLAFFSLLCFFLQTCHSLPSFCLVSTNFLLL